MAARDFKISTVSATMHDTGIGREAGFEDDEALVAHVRRERAKLDPEVRDLVERVDRRLEQRFLFGDKSF